MNQYTITIPDTKDIILNHLSAVYGLPHTEILSRLVSNMLALEDNRTIYETICIVLKAEASQFTRLPDEDLLTKVANKPQHKFGVAFHYDLGASTIIGNGYEECTVAAVGDDLDKLEKWVLRSIERPLAVSRDHKLVHRTLSEDIVSVIASGDGKVFAVIFKDPPVPTIVV